MEKQYIPGIYNYCDRWCERCGFTSRCRNYENTTVESGFGDVDFERSIASHFKNTLTLLQKSAEKYGIDLDTLNPEDLLRYQLEEERLNADVEQHNLIKLCKHYQQIALPFICKSESHVNKTRELIDDLHIGILSAEDVVYTVADIGNCFDTIRWYLFFIEVKLHRSLRGRVDNEQESSCSFQKEGDGTAKIALIAIEKSIDAWVKLYELMPASEDISLPALSVLSKIKGQALTTFPDAPIFKRPGFDD